MTADLLTTVINTVLGAKKVRSGFGPPRAYCEVAHGARYKRFVYITYNKFALSEEEAILDAALFLNAALLPGKSLLWRTSPELMCAEGIWSVYFRYVQLDDDSTSICVRWDI